MGNETTYLGVMSGLIRLISALNANAVDRAHLGGARLRLAKIATDVERIARLQAAFAAELNLQQFHGRKPRTPKASSPSDLAAVANSKQ